MPSLTNDDKQRLLEGIQGSGFTVTQVQADWQNPARIRLEAEGGARRFRVWLFSVTHGGGPRKETEFRIQATKPHDQPHTDEVRDVLMGYHPEENVLVGVPADYLPYYAQRKPGSPSIQVSQTEIEAGRTTLHVFSKRTTNFGDRNFATFPPTLLPVFLAHEQAILDGTLSPQEAVRRAPTPMTDVDLEAFIRNSGLHFDPRLVARYVAALMAKPFVILCGATGTGKTKLAQVVADYYTRTGGEAPSRTDWPRGDEMVIAAPGELTSPDRVAFVPVRPDWTETSHVVGYHNPLMKRYEQTAILRLMRHAVEHPSLPHFLILDELNLAKVEYYFADFLSCMESGEPITLHEVTEEEAKGVPQRLKVPLNLYITGTVNVDETTQSLSPKVLDRAHVIEFDDVDLDGLRGQRRTGTAPLALPRMLPAYKPSTAATYERLAPAIHELLKLVNEVLGPAQFRLGYRSACEIAAFVQAYAPMLGEPPDAPPVIEALVLQKVLPRLHGGRVRLEEPLRRLKHLMWTGTKPPAELPATLATQALYEACVQRLDDMLRVLTTQGFVTFFR